MFLNCFYSSTLIYGLSNFLFVNLKSTSTFRNGRDGGNDDYPLYDGLE